MPEITRTDAVYTWISEASVATRYGTNPPTLYANGLDNAGVKDAWTLIGLSSPVPLGVVVHSAKLRVRNAGARSGSSFMRARRPITKWDPGTANWKVRPSISASFLNQTVTKVSPAINTVWEFDITTLMQAVASGTAKWYGIMIESNAGSAFSGSIRGKGAYAPEFVINFSHPTAVLEDMTPSNGGVVATPNPTLSASFDYSGESPVNALQVQLSTSENFAAPIWDSGAIVATEPELDLASQSGVPALAASTQRWWRMRVRNPDGVWGEWSEPASFQYVPHGTLAITAPAGGLMGSTVPDVNWTFSGSQQFYQVILTDYDDGTIYYDSGKIDDPLPGDTVESGALRGMELEPTSQSSSGLPSWALRWVTFQIPHVFKVVVRVWDNLNRQNVPGFPIYVEKETGPLIIKEDATLAPASNVEVTTDFPSPEVTFRFNAPAEATTFSIVHDGKYYENGLLLAAYLNPNNGKYEYTTTVSVGKDGRPSNVKGWQVLIETGSKTSGNNVAYSIRSETEFAWISNPNPTKTAYRHVPLVGIKPIEGSLTEKGQIVEPLRSQVPYKVFTVLGKYRGTVTAQLVPGAIPDDTRSLAILKAAILEMRKQAAIGGVMKLALADLLLNVTIHNVNLWPATGAGYGRAYDVTFEWFEV